MNSFKNFKQKKSERNRSNGPQSTYVVLPHVESNLVAEFLEWPNAEIESAVEDVVEDQPSTSSAPLSKSAKLIPGIVEQLKIFYPENHENIIKSLFEMIISTKSDNDLQGELIDLLGVEQFELAAEILDKRCQLCTEFMNEAEDARKMAKIAAKANVPAFLQTVSVQSQKQNEARRELRKEQKRAQRELSRVIHAFGNEEKLEMELAQKEIARQRQLEIDSMRFNSSIKINGRPQEIYPFVFDSRIQSIGTQIELNGMRFALPEGSRRDNFKTHDMVFVPPPQRQDIDKIQHVYIKDMDELGKKGFAGYEKLNVIQSIVFEQAYKTKENLLICAPTGAGKTNIAMLTILNTIHEHMNQRGEIVKDDFKIIYIAPMKALATEMTESFGKRLAPLGLKVRELTGDTQLSRNEITDTQMLVLTPEKWDVITRKGTSDNSLISLVRLLIIDEVHLLHDERGPVIETIVARTLRQVEISQTGVRIVGLSATLPNYIDVARFLRVNPYKGLFFFDGRFRPVPLTQKFIGIRKAGDFRQNQKLLDDVCYDEVIDFVKRGHQVLVFVHTRNGTAKLAEAFSARASVLGHLEHFIPQNSCSQGYSLSEKAVNNSRNRGQLSTLFGRGFGIHHAGLCRSDRILMEKCFASGHISVLFCTATLAWGVNLPAHAVVIRGTDVFDAEKASFVDLGVLDVQQIFGRAGRPQFENEGHGVIITTRDKMDKYLMMLVHQNPIESQFYKRIHDNLNAEIALGSVSTIDEAVEWLTYTYMYTRALQNPMAYGMSYNVLDRDPDLREHFTRMMKEVAFQLDNNQLIRFDQATEYLYSTDLGRIASNFYVKYETMQFLKEAENDKGLPVCFTGFMPDDMALGIISMASEFAQLKVREEECPDLEELVSYGCMLNVRGGGLASVAGKVNVLLQSLISRTHVRNFALMSEQMYVQQNAGRICRALFEIVLRKGWAHATNAFLCMAKYIEKQMWPNQSPLRQFLHLNMIPINWIEKIERRKLTESQLLDLQPKELGHMFSCDGERVYTMMRYLPRMDVEAKFKPITYTVMQVEVQLTPAFIWNDRIHGKSGQQSFYMILENINENLIVHQERIGVGKLKVSKQETQHIIFTIPISDRQLTNNYQLRIASDYFVTEDVVVPLSLHNCILPKSFKAHTDLLLLDPLPVKALKNALFESIYKFDYFNPIQTQVFFSLYKTDKSALVGAPTGSGKTCCAELAMFRLLQGHPGKKIVYIAPLKSLVRERVDDWKSKFEENMGYKVVEVSGDVTPDPADLAASSILITTPEKWDGISRSWATREYVRQVGLIVLDEIHLLGVDRGAVLEAIVSRLKMITRRSYTRDEPVRLLGLSTALANAGDVAEWLGIPNEGLYNFRPSVRPVPISVHIQGFPGQHYCPRMALMNKPAYKAILTYSPTKPILVFVSSRRQTRLTALAFVNLLIADHNPKQWLHMDMGELDILMQSIKDENLKLTLPFGIGMHHAGLSAHERAIVEQLYIDKKIQVLIATATLAWGINCPAHLVIVKGTEYFDGKKGKYVDFPVTDVLQMMGRAGRPQYDDSAVAVIYVQDSKKLFYKKFLYEPFPVESSLLPVLPNHVNAEISSGTIDSKQGIVEYLSGTYLYRRLFANPNFYGLEEESDEAMLHFITEVVDNSVIELVKSECITVDDESNLIKPTAYGRIASVYYLQHETIRLLISELHDACGIEEMLRIMTHVPEYSEIPVRHNEDLINTELQRKLRIRFSTSLMGASHTKAHLLFQAHFMRTLLPTDYRTDLKSVLDQCVRILQAMREMTRLKSWLQATLCIIILQQMCHSARWHDDHPLLALPNLSVDDAIALGAEMTIPQLQQLLGVESATSATDAKLVKKAKQLFYENTTLDETQTMETLKAICSWPIVSINIVQFMDSSGTVLANVDLDGKCSPIRVKSAQNYRVRIVVERHGPFRNSSAMHLPQWGKPKQAGWILCIGDVQRNMLLSSTSLMGSNSTRSTAKMELRIPEKRGKTTLSLYLMSDCYLGIDQEYQIALIIE
ncbi:unnamed protein product [Caenorhabditis bovis]|uniref:Activating signal cointegrator 1 complex subunit 3 n=1 Tax=Caenorhabditis bovis TaxID=2654633 RepID=A0A8S1EX80_9PELO|nr:unnamed protein product [Caenorhabditis bovis]